jgi:D-alanyl-D-alanine carboxypeptidase
MIVRKLSGILLAACLLITCQPLPLQADDSSDTISNASASLSASVSSSLTSDNAFVIDIDTGQILLDKASTEQIYPASLTKMLTVLTALDQGVSLTDEVTITDEMLAGLSEANASVAGYYVGETLTVQDLLYGIIMPSGADACNALAIHTAGSIDAFVELMNEEAASIGMTSSHFVNPTGLHDDNHYSTCRDIALLLEAGLANATFKSVFTAYTYTDSSGTTFVNSSRQAISANDYDVEGLQGCKSGYTDEAGHCLASYEEINGMRLITVTAHAMTDILTYSNLTDTSAITVFLADTYEQSDVISEGDTIASYTAEEVIGSRDETVTADSDIALDVPIDAEITITDDVPSSINVSSEDQDKTCTVTICADKAILAERTISYTVKKADDIFNRLFCWIRDLIS